MNTLSILQFGFPSTINKAFNRISFRRFEITSGIEYNKRFIIFKTSSLQLLSFLTCSFVFFLDFEYSLTKCEFLLDVIVVGCFTSRINRFSLV